MHKASTSSRTNQDARVANRNVLQGKGRGNPSKANKMTAPTPINTPSLRLESRQDVAPPSAPRMGWSGQGSPRQKALSPKASTLHADAAPWVKSPTAGTAFQAGRWGDDAVADAPAMNPYVAPFTPQSVWAAPSQWNGHMYAQTQLYQQGWPDAARYDPVPAWSGAPVQILKRDVVTPAQIQAILSPRSAAKHVAFQQSNDGNFVSPKANRAIPSKHADRPPTPKQQRRGSGSVRTKAAASPRHATPVPRDVRREQEEILAVLSDGGDLPRDHKPKKLSKKATPASPRSAKQQPSKQQPSKAVLKERDEILAVLSDGGDLPRDHKPKKLTKKANKGAPMSPRSAKQSTKAVLSPRSNKQPSKAVLKERDEILAVLSDGGDLPRDHKPKKMTKKAAKPTPLSPRSAKQPTKAVLSPRGAKQQQQFKQPSKAVLKEREEILAVLSDGGDLPRDHKPKKLTKKAAKPTPLSPRTAKQSAKAALSPRSNKQPSKAVLKEREEILAVLSDGGDLPRDHKPKKLTKKANKVAPLSPRSTKQPARAALSPRSAKQQPSKQQTSKQQPSKAVLKEREEILAVLSDGGDLPRDHKPKKMTKKSAAMSPRSAKQQSSKQFTTATVQKERDEILAVLSDGGDLPRDHRKAKTAASPRAKDKSTRKAPKPSTASVEAREIFNILSDDDDYVPKKRPQPKKSAKKAGSPVTRVKTDWSEPAAFATKSPASVQHKVDLSIKFGGGVVVVSPAHATRAMAADTDGFEQVKSRKTVQAEKKEHAARAQSQLPICHVAEHKHGSSCLCHRAHAPEFIPSGRARAPSASSSAVVPAPSRAVPHPLAPEFVPSGRKKATVWTKVSPAPSPEKGSQLSAEKKAQILRSLSKALLDASPKKEAMTQQASPTAKRAPPVKASPAKHAAQQNHIHKATKGARATLST